MATGSATDPRVGQLADQVAELSRRVDDLSRRVDALSSAPPRSLPWPPPEDSGEARQRAPEAGPLSTVLTSCAAVSFLLVIALALRTITDNGLIDRTAGTWIGLAYAALVLAFGHFRHAAGIRQAPVYSTWGALLVLSIVYEGHVRFTTVSTPTGTALIAATMLALSATGFRFRSPAPLIVGTLGAGSVALALDFPHPVFAALMPVLLLANVTAFAARTVPSCAWLKWALFALSMVVWPLWTTQLRTPLLRGEPLPPHAGIDWFLPALVAFALAYLGCALWSLLRDQRRAARFAHVLVVANVLWSYGAAAALAGPWLGRQQLIAAVAVGLAGAHLGGAGAFARAVSPRAMAVLSLTWAGLLLLAMALSTVAGHQLAVLLWAATATGIGFAAARAGIAGARLTSYAYQGFAFAMAIGFGTTAAASPAYAAHTAALAGLCALAGAHYLACRRGLAGDPTRLRIRPEDRFGVLPLAFGLVYLFAALRSGLYPWLTPETADAAARFHAAQSMLINAIAVGLMAVGCLRRDGELFVVSLVVGALGAFRVFGHDLFAIQGLPLVCSVFSFGLATAVGSLLWRRWQRTAPSPAIPPRTQPTTERPEQRAQ